jgi:tRNA modification GTPase
MTETIVALSTPPGIAGISVIRVSGSESFAIVDSCFSGKTRISDAKSHTIHYGKYFSGEKLIDMVTVAVFRAPHSYTGEDVAEISCHGGYFVYNAIIDELSRAGARQAQAGEFTRRAFINGKLDLLEVEAVADIIHSVSVPGAETSARQLSGQFSAKLSMLREKLLKVAGLLELELDFADEDIELTDSNEILDLLRETESYTRELSDSFKSAEILRSGFYVGIAGYPNSGKSTLFNAIIGHRRAIVNEMPGTTRDYIEEQLVMNGLTFKFIDTAGIRETHDSIEIEGIKFVESIISQSNLIIIVNDYSLSATNSDALFDKLRAQYAYKDIVILQNKIDLTHETATGERELFVSAKNNIGIDRLKSYIIDKAKSTVSMENNVLINQRHAYLLTSAADHLLSARMALQNGAEKYLVSIDVRASAELFGEVTGENWNEEVLNNIFSNFCIGK